MVEIGATHRRRRQQVNRCWWLPTFEMRSMRTILLLVMAAGILQLYYDFYYGSLIIFNKRRDSEITSNGDVSHGTTTSALTKTAFHEDQADVINSPNPQMDQLNSSLPKKRLLNKIATPALNDMPLKKVRRIMGYDIHDGSFRHEPLHSSNSGVTHFDLPNFPPVLLLPAPILVVGFPKSGTTTVWSYFHCGGVPSSHETCGVPWYDGRRWRRRICGECIRKNIETGKDPLEGCGGQYAVWAEMNMSVKNPSEEMPEPYIYLPQVLHLNKFHEAYPDATLILNLRDVDGWIRSVDNWGEKILRKLLIDTELPNLPAGKGALDEDLKNFYLLHAESVRNFVIENPTHTLVEVDIESPDAGNIMENAFGISSTCWGQTNANLHLKNKSV